MKLIIVQQTLPLFTTEELFAATGVNKDNVIVKELSSGLKYLVDE
jgi:hypothetical protein